MPSARDVSANPSRTMIMTASKSDRRLRTVATRPRSATQHANPSSDEQLDQAVHSIRQLAKEMNQSARDELTHILEADKPDVLSLIMDIAERDSLGALPLKPTEEPRSPSTRDSDIHDQSFQEEKPQIRIINTPAPVRWRKWVGFIIFTMLIATAAVLLSMAAPHILSGTHKQKENRQVAALSNLPETARPSSRSDHEVRLPTDNEAAIGGRTLPSTDAALREVVGSLASKAHDRASDMEMPSTDPNHHGTPHRDGADERQRVGSVPSVAIQPGGTQQTFIGHSKDERLHPPQTDLSPATEKQLLQRAEALLQNRDISGARLILERAITLGSAKAAYHLAQTYDPAILDGWQVRGIGGDMAKSRELRELARTLALKPSGASAATP